MEQYLSHLSAAMDWNIPYIQTVLGDKILGAASTYITVSEHDARFRINGKRVHSCVLALPTGAIIFRNGRTVSSPELLFLELANELSIHRLILLGFQLCSHPDGLSSKPITTKQNIITFLEKTTGQRGHRKAMRAVKYLENGSASIMESLAYMILSLPNDLGGYGLNGAVFNYKIKLNDDARIRLSQNRCFVDLYYKQAKVAVEYDSFTHHSSPAEQGKDAMRSDILERQGINVMHLSTIQLYNKDACGDFARNLAVRINKRIHIRSSRFDEMHKLLRELLPDRNREPELHNK